MKANDNRIINHRGQELMIEEMSKKFKEILQIMKLDVDEDQQIKDTPNRIARSWINDLFSGCYNHPPKLTVFENENEIDSMVFVGPVDIKSTCSHHFIPFTGSCYIAYIPSKQICGISKLARIVEWYMRRPQIQEELTKQIADYIIDKLNPKGVAVYIEAQHMCMTMRGVEQSNSFMKTSELRGCFKEAGVRKEFFDMIIT